MSESKTPGDRRAQHVALLGCAVQSAASILLLILALWADRSHLLLALAHFLSVGVPIWLILYLVLNQIRRVGIEALETQELQRAREAGTSQAIFELDEEALLLEQNRLKWMVRWLLPSGTVAVALFLLVGHFLLWGRSLDDAFNENVLRRTGQPTLVMWFVIGVGFLCFLYARYALALARLPQWGLIRAGAVCMAGSALVCVLAAIALMASPTIEWAEPLAAYVIPVALLLLGVEFAVNFVLDLYRSRTADEVPRPSFDSRLLGMIGEPGGIAKSIADAVNYQFGFRVSSTWFYQLLQRWLFPIMVVAFAAVLMLTSVVIVDADEEVVIERFGRLLREPREVLSPGLHFKWPYPVDVVYRVPTRRISELVIGEAAEEDDDEHGHKLIVWTEKHEYVPELMLLVASPSLETLSSERQPSSAPEVDSVRREGSESVAVSLLMASVPIEYRIKDVTEFLYVHDDPRKLLEVVAYQYLSDYAASVDIDEFMGPGRTAFNRDVKRALQSRLDERDAGIEVVFAGLRDAHPPAKSKVAETFQAVVSAETKKAALIHAAEGEARRILISAVGTEARAKALDEAIRARDLLPAGSSQLAQARKLVEDLLLGNPEKGIAPVSGEAAALIADARAMSSDQISRAAAKALTFGTQLAAFQAAPDLYRHRKTLGVYSGLENTRKYLIVGDRSNVIVVQDTTSEAGLDQVLREGVAKERAKQKP